jgi:hypothetical protein
VGVDSSSAPPPGVAVPPSPPFPGLPVPVSDPKGEVVVTGLPVLVRVPTGEMVAAGVPVPVCDPTGEVVLVAVRVLPKSGEGVPAKLPVPPTAPEEAVGGKGEGVVVGVEPMSAEEGEELRLPPPAPMNEVGVGRGGEGVPLPLPTTPPAVPDPEKEAEGEGKAELDTPPEGVKGMVGVTKVVVVPLVRALAVPPPSKDTVGEEEKAALPVPAVLDVGLSVDPALVEGRPEVVGSTCVPVGVKRRLGDPAPPLEGVSVVECVGLPVPRAPLGEEDRVLSPPKTSVEELPTPPPPWPPL